MRTGTGGTSTNSYYLLDQQGSVLKLTDSTGNTDTAAYSYDPYGQTTNATGAQATLNPYRYATGYYDASTGLYKLGVRYYNPNRGAFTQQDPTGEDAHAYAYADDNPIGGSDPLGAFCILGHSHGRCRGSGVFHRSLNDAGNAGTVGLVGGAGVGCLAGGFATGGVGCLPGAGILGGVAGGVGAVGGAVYGVLQSIF